MTQANCINESSGSFTVQSGNLVVSAGTLVASAGSISSYSTVTAGTNLISTAGNLLLPTTSATVGQIQFNSAPWFYGYGTGSLFVGPSSGNFTFTVAQATNNVGIGQYALHAITGGHTSSDAANVAVGSGSMRYMIGSASSSNINAVQIGCQAGGYSTGASTTTNMIGIGDSATYDWGEFPVKTIGIGTNAAYKINNDNIAIGYKTLPGNSNWNITTNVAIGAYAGYHLATNQWQAVLIGYYAAYTETSVEASGWVSIGSQSTANLNYGSYYSVYIGYKSGYSLNTSSVACNYNIGIGYNSGYGSVSEANTMHLGTLAAAGTGATTSAFISGIYGKGVGATAGVMITDSVDKSGTLSAAANKLFTGGTKPVFSTATYPATTAQGDLIYSSAANTVSSLALSASAKRYLSNTGTSNNPAWAQVSLTTGVTNVLPASNGGDFQYIPVTSSPQAISNGSAYIANMGTLVTFTLPVTAAIGTRFRIVGLGAGGWLLTENTGQTIHYRASSSTTTSGSVDATGLYNSLTFVCVTANSDWVITQAIGSVNLY